MCFIVFFLGLPGVGPYWDWFCHTATSECQSCTHVQVCTMSGEALWCARTCWLSPCHHMVYTCLYQVQALCHYTEQIHIRNSNIHILMTYNKYTYINDIYIYIYNKLIYSAYIYYNVLCIYIYTRYMFTRRWWRDICSSLYTIYHYISMFQYIHLCFYPCISPGFQLHEGRLHELVKLQAGLLWSLLKWQQPWVDGSRGRLKTCLWRYIITW